MTPEVGLLGIPALDRPVPPTAVPLLIEVPLVRVTTRRPAHTAARRRRRRLRREVRLGGAAMLMGLPLAWAMLSLGGLRSREAYSSMAGGVPAAPIVVLSPELEPAPGGETGEAPVVRPAGYLLPELPEDVAEEPHHAGT
jgi:hypothetical protein